MIGDTVTQRIRITRSGPKMLCMYIPKDLERELGLTKGDSVIVEINTIKGDKAFGTGEIKFVKEKKAKA